MDRIFGAWIGSKDLEIFRKPLRSDSRSFDPILEAWIGSERLRSDPGTLNRPGGLSGRFLGLALGVEPGEVERRGGVGGQQVEELAGEPDLAGRDRLY